MRCVVRDLAEEGLRTRTGAGRRSGRSSRKEKKKVANRNDS